jgi:nucleoside-diphosphate-sugar epimerase
MTKVLITGANSFIGKNFKKYSKYSDQKEVCLLSCPIESINFEGYNIVLHLAAIVHISDRLPESEYFKINRDLCLEVAKRAKSNGVNHFIFLSSSKVYGSQGGKEVLNENSDCFPDDSYGKSKYEAEILLKELEDFSFTVSIIRTPIVYGEGVKANMLSIMKLIDTVPILPFKGLDNKISITFVGNLVGLIDCIIEKRSSGTFIALDEKPLSTNELVKYISKYLGKKIYLFTLPRFLVRLTSSFFPREMDSLFNSFTLDNLKTREELGYAPPISTEDGIERMVSYYKSIKNAGD